VKLRAVFPNAKLALWPGIFINVRLLVETLHNSVVVPVAAVQRGPKGAFVYVADQETAVMRPVTLGQQDDKQAVVTTGVHPGDVVVTTGFSKLADGSPIAAEDDKTAAPANAAPALHHSGVAPPAAGSDSSDRAPRRRDRETSNGQTNKSSGATE